MALMLCEPVGCFKGDVFPHPSKRLAAQTARPQSGSAANGLAAKRLATTVGHFDFSDGQSDGVGALFRRRGLYRIWPSEKSDCVVALGTSTTRARTAPIQTQNRRPSQAYKSYKRSGFISSRLLHPLWIRPSSCEKNHSVVRLNFRLFGGVGAFFQRNRTCRLESREIKQKSCR